MKPHLLILGLACLCVLASGCASGAPDEQDSPPLGPPRPILRELEYYSYNGSGLHYFRILPDGTMAAAWSIGGMTSDDIEKYRKLQTGHGGDEGRQGKLSPDQLARVEAELTAWDRLSGQYGDWASPYARRVINFDGQRVVSFLRGPREFNQIADAIEKAALSLPESNLRASDVWRYRWDPSWRPWE